MLPLRDSDRVRILSAVAKRGPGTFAVRVVTMTLSLAILAAVPVLGLVRIDLWGGRHLLLGRPATAVDAMKGFLVAMAVLYGVTFLTNIVVGRFFCGFGCPVGYASRLGESVDRARGSRLRTLARHLLGAGFVAAFVAAVLLWWVDPAILHQGSPAARVLLLGVFAVLAAGGYLHAFRWRFLVCTRACPIGLYYRYVTSRAPIGILFSESPSACIECGACTAICPVDLDPRALGRETGAGGPQGVEPGRYGDAECLRCGDCVEACKLVFRRRPESTPPLRFGRHGARDRAPREPSSREGALSSRAATRSGPAPSRDRAM
jgi:ferredoxin-type protein NapH